VVAVSLKNQQPTAADVRAPFVANLCRCTGYVRIVDGVLAAAEQA
jgi:aerobic-type carbon monoxide dehydrogenase small subunit (CoxS/CutS family)